MHTLPRLSQEYCSSLRAVSSMTEMIDVDDDKKGLVFGRGGGGGETSVQ